MRMLCVIVPAFWHHRHGSWPALNTAVSGGATMESPRAEGLLPWRVPGEAKVYLAPRDPCRRAGLESLIDSGGASPLAGGSLAFSVCEVAIRTPGRVQRATATLTEIQAWTGRQAGAVQERVEMLLGNLSRDRAGVGGEPMRRPRLMGILNVTPDSFSDGGQHLDPAAAITHGLRLAEAGADILDVGGESTRPGAAPVAPETELARVLPALQGLAAARPTFPGLQISIDTRHASVMRAALAAGVGIVNDVTALAGDPASPAAVAASTAAVVLMHMRGEPRSMNEAPVYEDVALDVFDELEARIQACVGAGIGRHRIIVDPGIGFAKRGPHNLAVLRSLALYHGLGCPILLGVSRKSIGSEAEQRLAPKDRLPTSLAAAMHGLNQGVQILRVHDVGETHRVVDLWQRLHGPDNDH
jgi:dihydropteroate synthase